MREIDRVREAERDRAEREDFLAFQLREIEELDPSLGEETELESERARLRHAEKLQGATQGAADRLYEGEDAVCDQLARVVSELDAAAAIDPSLAPLARRVEASRSELADVARALARYAAGIESSPERLAEVDERWFRLQKLFRKHGPTTNELARLSRRARSKQVEELGGAPQLLEASSRRSAKRALAAVAAEARRAFAQASRRRGEARRRDRPRARRPRDGPGARRRRRLARAGAAGRASCRRSTARGSRSSGIDRVEFLIAPNKGEDPRPLRRIASGGELSRALLALKRVLAEKGPAGLYVFDEVDAGVSGAIAEVIGRAIADVARHRQVLCITHLPQIAALADAQYVVDKSEAKGRTTSAVRKLSDDERDRRDRAHDRWRARGRGRAPRRRRAPRRTSRTSRMKVGSPKTSLPVLHQA